MKRILSHTIFRSADKHPDNIAFKQGDVAITYEQLVHKSNCTGQFLKHLGLSKGDRIGIFMNRSVESAQVIYGAFNIGAAYVPIDSNLPVARIIEILSDCNITVLFSNNNYKQKLTKIKEVYPALSSIIGLTDFKLAETICFSWHDVLSVKSERPNVNVSEKDIAYIMYTSGTTGKPKGIVHTHFSGFSYAQLSADLYKLHSTDVLANHSQLHYDISTMGYLTIPLVGATSVIITEGHTIFPKSLGQLIEDDKISIWYSVPLALIQLLKTDSLLDKDLSSMRWVLYGGESFAAKYIHQLFTLLPNAMFSNVYGPAEVNQCTYFNFDSTCKINDPIPIGKAWDETDIIIIDEEGKETDSVGELYVSSSTQMKEYWNREDLTKSRLHTFQKQKAGRYYKTGDIVEQLENGDMVFLGRSDRQVKVRGYRVELNEVELTLLKHINVTDAAVYAKTENDAKIICAAVVTDSKLLSADQLIKHTSTYLPSYAIPANIIIAEAIPRTGAGKIDYKQLENGLK